MANVSLILPKTQRGGLDHPFPPLGILYLGASLQKNNFNVEVVDGNIMTSETYKKRIENIESDVIGISATFFHMNEVKRLLPKLKKREKPIIVGGPGVSSIINKKKFLEDTKINFLLEGEAEETLPFLLKNLYDEERINKILGIHRIYDGRFISNKKISRVDVNKNPIPARELIDLNIYTKKWGNYTGLIASRGCPYRCTFCDLSVAGHKIRYRDVTNVVKEMKELNKKGLEDIFVFDDLFTANIKYLESFRNLKEKLGLKMTWGGNARVNLVDDYFCRIIKESEGVRLFMGIESGSEKVLQLYNKRTTPVQIIKAFEKCKKYGISPNGYVLIGHPEETWDDIQKTADLINVIKPDNLDISILTPIPNTELFQNTKNLIDFSKLYSLDSRQKESVYKELKFNINEGLSLIKDAYESSK